jgi:transposase
VDLRTGVIEQATASVVSHRNRQLNAALHRIALTQARFHPPARELLDHHKSGGDGGMEALHILRRRLSDVVYWAMLADLSDPLPAAA